MQLRYWVFVSLLLFHIPLSAQKGESSRVLVHTLNYIAQDYPYAVSEGVVVSENEYAEMLDFSETALRHFKEFSSDWKPADSAAIGQLILALDSLIKIKASGFAVAEKAASAKNSILKATGLSIAPTQYPNLENGRLVYQANCAKCHGVDGHGDGEEGRSLEPLPRNFHDNARMKFVSPFFAFNATRLGIEGTPMPAHLTLTDEEVWDVSFYILSLRFESFKKHAAFQSKEVKEMLDSMSVGKIAITTDAAFLQSLSLHDSATAQSLLAAIRLQQPTLESSRFISLSINYLNNSINAYKAGRKTEASRLILLAYLEGIEPVEIPLKASEPGLVLEIEAQVHNIRKMMEQNKPLPEIDDSIQSLRLNLEAASELLGKKEYSFLLAFLMAASILLREGLEAFLVIMVILSIIKATHLSQSAIWVHAGWILALMTGVVMWFAGDVLLQNNMQHIELLEGGIALLAVFMLLYIGFWLHGKSEVKRWKEYVGQLMKGVVSKGSLWGLGGLSFFVVFREVFESVLFLHAMNIESGGKQTEAILLGVVIALVTVFIFALVVLKFSARLPIPKLFKISSIIMGVLAVILAGKGIHSFQEIGLVPIHGMPMFRVEWLGLFPTVETVLAQGVVLITVISVWKFAHK